MAEPASAVIQLIQLTYRTARYIQDFSKGVKDHNNRVRKLGETIERHGHSLETVYAVYERIKDRPGDDLRRSAKNLHRILIKSKEAIEMLASMQGEEESSTFAKVLRYWSYDQEGGKREIEGILRMIADLEASIHTELMAANLFITTASDMDTLSTGLARTFSGDETLTGASDIEVQGPAKSLSRALIAAINSCVPKEVKTRIKNGDSILACDSHGCNALHYAVKAGGRRVLAELLKSKEIRRAPNCLNAPNHDGKTPLHVAVELGKDKLVLELLNANSDVDCPDKHGRPPLERALSGNKDSIVELLLKHKADESLLRHENKVNPLIARRLVQVKQIMHARS